MNTTDNFTKHTSQNPLQKFFIERFNEKLLDTIKNLDVATILDVGCGEGFTLQRLKDTGIGKKLEGVEYLDRAIELGKQHFPSITIKQGTIFDLQYKDNSFDLVLCNEVLEHVQPPEKALKELKRVTSKYLLLSVPNEPIFMASNFLRGKNVSRWGNDIEHINHWSRNSFKKFVEKELQVQAIYNPFPWTLLLAKKQ